jgi:serine/threonine-protein kinase HipA
MSGLMVGGFNQFCRPSVKLMFSPSHADAPRNDVPKLKFSLAGVQLKFSSVKVGGRLTLPANGTTGNVIAKLPHAQYPDLPEIEFSSMMLAHAAGVDIASQVGLIKTNT